MRRRIRQTPMLCLANSKKDAECEPMRKDLSVLKREVVAAGQGVDASYVIWVGLTRSHLAYA